MIRRVADALTGWCTRYIPDAYVIAGLLTVIVFGLAMGVAGAGPLELVRVWGDAFWKQFGFTMAMAMVILTGYIVADAGPVKRLLVRLAAVPQTPRAAVAMMAMLSMGLAWINWGLSIIASAMVARRLGRRRLGVDFRLLVATAYLGLGCMWHAGLSASAPLTSANPGDKLVLDKLGGHAVPVTATVFSWFNLALAAAVLVVMTLLATALQPKAGSPEPTPAGVDDDDADDDAAAAPRITRSTSPAEWLERTPVITGIVVAAIVVYLVAFVADKGLARINIDHINLTFLGAGALLHWTPASLLRSAERGGRYVWGVLLQFAFYAGIGGMLQNTGLASRIADGFVGVATPKTFPLIVVWYSGLLNYAVPSGGAKWFIEAPYLIDAANRLGVPLERTIVAYAWGDMLTDIIQPFWAIPLLALARLGFRDIMGYCLIFFVVYAALVSGGFLAWGVLW